jgi:hypothetical protein
MSNGTQTSTPPRASTTPANPAKPISRYPSTWTPVTCSTVWVSSFGPPNANAALILLLPWPGIGT